MAPDDSKRNVSVVFDELKIKAGLVYCKRKGHIVGYLDLGTISNDLRDFEAQMVNDGQPSSPASATHILSVMVRGIFSFLHKSLG